MLNRESYGQMKVPKVAVYLVHIEEMQWSEISQLVKDKYYMISLVRNLMDKIN